jgi:hypothetical protein
MLYTPGVHVRKVFYNQAVGFQTWAVIYMCMWINLVQENGVYKLHVHCR